MIDLQYIADKFNKIIGTNDFVVFLDTNISPVEDDTGRTISTMLTTRNPQALGGAVDSETLTLTFYFDFDLTDREQALRRKAALTQILGWQSFQVKTAECEIYDVDTWLDMLPPEPARVDSGKLMQVLSVSGTALVTNHSVGAIVSNRVRTYINGEEVVALNYSAALTKGVDELINLSDDSYQAEPQEISRANTVDITILYTGTVIDRHFRNLIENGEDESGEYINTVYNITRVYPDMGSPTHEITLSKKMKLIEATNIGQVGAYLYYRLTLRKVEMGNISYIPIEATDY